MRWLKCAGLALGVGMLATFRGQCQELEGAAGPDRAAGMEESGPAGAMDFGRRGASEPLGFPDPRTQTMGAGRGGFAQGGPRGFPGGGDSGATRGMRGPMGPGNFSGHGMGRGDPRDPEARQRRERLFLLRRQVMELAKRYREAGAPEKGQVKGELKQALAELLDADIAARAHRAKKLQEEAGKLKEGVSKAKAGKDKIVSRAFEQLTADDGWEW